MVAIDGGSQALRRTIDAVVTTDGVDSGGVTRPGRPCSQESALSWVVGGGSSVKSVQPGPPGIGAGVDHRSSQEISPPPESAVKVAHLTEHALSLPPLGGSVPIIRLIPGKGVRCRRLHGRECFEVAG